ncbi:hypothetical protein SO802_033756 [Lithocarpus litseifolius]|uniref:Disease resistance N-terminal domain-containing protein n=1 Tax=Lithocarpus litseifolius TaxID=425828 RepID=A0AAW2BE57_9ROSI
MADILLSALVSSMVGNLNTSALQEFGVAWGLRTELENLGSTLSATQAVLQDAEEKQWNSDAVRNWLRKLKDGAYDAEDVLDEFATEALRRKGGEREWCEKPINLVAEVQVYKALGIAKDSSYLPRAKFSLSLLSAFRSRKD